MSICLEDGAFNTQLWLAMDRCPLNGGFSISDAWDLEEVRLVERINSAELQRILRSLNQHMIECSKCGQWDASGAKCCPRCSAPYGRP